METLNVETVLLEHRNTITDCLKRGEGRYRLMSRLSKLGVQLTELQARRALIVVKYAGHPKAKRQQREEFQNILEQTETAEEKICAIAEQRGWLVSMKTLRTMMELYAQKLSLKELDRRYGAELKQRAKETGDGHWHCTPGERKGME